MKKAILALLASILMAPFATGAAPSDVTAPIRQFIDAFNSGDMKAAYATYATGDITIIDEFAPHRWVGSNAAQDWAADYDKHAKSTGVTDGKVTYGKPTRTEIEADLAYVVMPTTYLYKEHGKPMVEEGQITVVLHAEGGAWKMSGWTWSGVKPHAAK
jgi:ketosteroid isomerase-like protein